MFVSYMMMTKRKNDQCIYLGYGHTIRVYEEKSVNKILL